MKQASLPKESSTFDQSEKSKNQNEIAAHNYEHDYENENINKSDCDHDDDKDEDDDKDDDAEESVDETAPVSVDETASVTVDETASVTVDEIPELMKTDSTITSPDSCIQDQITDINDNEDQSNKQSIIGQINLMEDEGSVFVHHNNNYYLILHAINQLQDNNQTISLDNGPNISEPCEMEIQAEEEVVTTLQESVNEPTEEFVEQEVEDISNVRRPKRRCTLKPEVEMFLKRRRSIDISFLSYPGRKILNDFSNRIQY